MEGLRRGVGKVWGVWTPLVQARALLRAELWWRARERVWKVWG